MARGKSLSTEPTATQAARSSGAGSDGAKRSNMRRSLVTRDLLDHATRLFAEHGYESTTLRDVAEAVGVSRSSLYHYVSNKEDLLAMLVEQWSRGLADSMAALRTRSDLSAEQKLRELAELIVRQRAESPDQFRVLDQSEPLLPEPLRTQHRQARRDVLAELSGVIEEGVASGDFKPLDARIAALSVLGMCNWVAWWYRPGEGHDLESVARQITQSVADMLVDTHHRGSDSASSALARARASLDTLERLLPGEGGATS